MLYRARAMCRDSLKSLGVLRVRKHRYAPATHNATTSGHIEVVSSAMEATSAARRAERDNGPPNTQPKRRTKMRAQADTTARAQRQGRTGTEEERGELDGERDRGPGLARGAAEDELRLLVQHHLQEQAGKRKSESVSGRARKNTLARSKCMGCVADTRHCSHD